MRKMLAGALIIVAGLFFLSAPNAYSQICNGDFDCDHDVDGTDAVKFKADFFRKDCPDCLPCVPPAPVPKTGQTNAYGVPGSDGDLLRGVEWPVPRFTDNENGTVTDNLTGLIWLQNANCFGPRQWSQAITDCHDLVAPNCGLTADSSVGDWRLPNRFELESLLDMEFYEPALSNSAGTGQWIYGDPFINLLTDGYYWSSTTYADDTGNAWSVGMYSGDVYGSDKSFSSYVWPVRGGQ